MERNPCAGWRRASEIMLLGTVCLVLYWLGNDQTSLWDRDEPRYAGTAKAMLERGDWVVPYFNDNLRFQKPILTYWLVALAYHWLGITEFAARFFSGLSVAGTCLVVYELGNRLFGRPAGLLAGLVLALAPVSFFLGKLCLPDGPQLLLGTWCWACWYSSAVPGSPLANGLPESSRRGAALGFWIGMALAILTKGPIIPAMIAASALVYKVVSGANWRDFALRWRVGPLVLAAIGLPWLLAIYYAAGPEFFAESLGRQVANRVVVAFDQRFLPPGYYILTLFVGMGPALAWAGLALFRQRAHWCQPGPVAFLLAWALGPMLLLELFRSKQIHYYAPAYPAWALLAASVLAPLWRGTTTLFQDVHGKRCLVWSLCGVLFLTGGFIAAGWKGPAPMAPWSFLAAGCLLAGGAFATGCFWQGRPRLALTIQGAATIIAWMFVSGGMLPSAEPRRIVRAAARELSDEHCRTGDRILLYRLFEPSMVYYGRRPLRDIWFDDRFQWQVDQSQRPTLTLLTAAEVERWAPRLGNRLQIVRAWHGWVKMHPDTVYLARIEPLERDISTLVEKEWETTWR